MQIFKTTIERNKAASKLCKELFPLWNKPPFQGELQRIIVKAWGNEATNAEIEKVGNWWMWFRNLVIENTFSNQSKELTMNFAIKAAQGLQPINIVTTRSPELVHAQIPNQGDLSLPRSKKAMATFKIIVDTSNNFLPTMPTIILADRTIDNLSEIEKHCNVEEVLDQNMTAILNISQNLGIDNLNLLRISNLKSSLGTIDTLIGRNGKPIVDIFLNDNANNLIEICTRESEGSHQRMFGWDHKESLKHNTNLAITMGLVGSAIKNEIPSSILIHNEAFISRGQLNNIFNPNNEPLPVICLRDLLERKLPKA